MIGQPLLLQRAFLIGELARIAALARRGHAEVEELAAERLDFLPGRRADILIVAGDPSRDIRDTRRLRRIIQAGRPLDPVQLRDQALSDGDARLAALIAAEGP